MKRFLSLCLLWLLAIFPESVQAEEDGPSKDVPELQVLQNYVGKWDVSIKDGNFAGGVSTARWILKGRFVEQSGFLTSKDGSRTEVLTLFTFDTERKRYRSWTFLSNGPASQAEMTWNAQSKTMTSVGPPGADGVRSTVTADFSEPGKERWKFEFTDPAGRVVGGMSGENTLRKDKTTKPIDSLVAKGIPPLTEEQKPLDRFLGTWHTDYRMPVAEWTPEEKRGSADLVYTREVGGQFVRERGTHSDGTVSTLLLTHDAGQKQYRGWWFNSQGLNNESVGRWDAAAQTFEWKGTDTNIIGSSQHRFVKDNSYVWKVEVRDKQQAVLFVSEGTSQRQKGFDK